MSEQSTKTAEQRIQNQRVAQVMALREYVGSAALEKWNADSEWETCVDLEAGEVVVHSPVNDIHDTYRFGFNSVGEVFLWSEEHGEQPPDELME